MKKTVITITGIRPDFIRMSEIFKKLDENFNHVLIHSGQHYTALLSDVFFDELNIRKPDYNLGIGGPNKEHFHQTAELSVKIIELIREKNLKPDLILFLGDSNSVVCSVTLKKEGYKIGHIEAGMRSGDKRMLEEINRIVCDACSDFLFVYHDNYQEKLKKENINKGVYVVGNTIVEVVKPFIPTYEKKRDHVILDIHRPENFRDPYRLKNIIKYAQLFKSVKLIGFPRTITELNKLVAEDKDLLSVGDIEIIELQPFKKYIELVYNANLLISDSGTAQEEPALLSTPVIVPRDFTERPESVEAGCSFMLDVNTISNRNWSDSFKWIQNYRGGSTKWLGDGKTSDYIIKILKDNL